MPFQWQQKEIEAFRLGDELSIPSGLDFSVELPSISKEESEILAKAQPASVHAARKIPGTCCRRHGMEATCLWGPHDCKWGGGDLRSPTIAGPIVMMMTMMMAP
jgi:hypothetical protein